MTEAIIIILACIWHFVLMAYILIIRNRLKGLGIYDYNQVWHEGYNAGFDDSRLGDKLTWDEKELIQRHRRSAHPPKEGPTYIGIKKGPTQND